MSATPQSDGMAFRLVHSVTRKTAVHTAVQTAVGPPTQAVTAQRVTQQERPRHKRPEWAASPDGPRPNYKGPLRVRNPHSTPTCSHDRWTMDDVRWRFRRLVLGLWASGLFILVNRQQQVSISNRSSGRRGPKQPPPPPPVPYH